MEVALQRFNKDYLNSRSPRLIVLGDDVPAEILYAVCDDPFYVLGGSLGTAHWADELTPRDTDPFSRSSLGWLLNPAFDLTENALIVTAVSSDSRRKLISVLQNNGRKVAALDIPPTRTANAAQYYKEQLTALAEMIGKHTGKHFTGGNLKRAVKRVANALFHRAISFRMGRCCWQINVCILPMIWRDGAHISALSAQSWNSFAGGMHSRRMISRA